MGERLDQLLLIWKMEGGAMSQGMKAKDNKVYLPLNLLEGTQPCGCLEFSSVGLGQYS